MNSAPVQMKIFLDATVGNPQNPKSIERRPNREKQFTGNQNNR